MNKLSMKLLVAVLLFSQVMNYVFISERVYAATESELETKLETETEEEHFEFNSETGTITGYKD